MQNTHTYTNTHFNLSESKLNENKKNKNNKQH